MSPADNKTPLSDAVGAVLRPMPLPDQQPNERQHDLLTRIERLERRFVGESSGKKRFRIRELIEKLEAKLTVESMLRHNAYLRQQLAESHDRETAMRNEMAELAEQWQALRDRMRASS